MKIEKYCESSHTGKHIWHKWSEKIEVSENKVAVGSFNNDSVRATAWFQERMCDICHVIETRKLYDCGKC